MLRPILFLAITALAFINALPANAQTLHHYTGPLGFYHITFGKTYLDSTGKDSIPVQQLLKEGEPCFPSQAIDQNMPFESEVDSCAHWQTNRIMGMIQPVSEHGHVNQPGDTVLMHPYAIVDSPGMVQAAHRFSTLSQLYGGFYGAVIDDWNHDTFTTRCVRAAIKGKPLNAAGQACFTCPSATLDNKLFVVMYGTAPDTANLPYIDGISYWPSVHNWWNLEAAIDELKKNFPHKELFMGIYIYNSFDHFIDPYIVHYLLAHNIDRYDNGDINGITLFPGPYLAQNRMSLAHWNSLALPHWLDSLYYPYLGAIKGLVYDCSTGAALQGVSIRAYCTARSTGDTLMRSYQRTSMQGQYTAGLWAGNRQTDSTKYWIVSTKEGYASDTTIVYLKRNREITVPDISLCRLKNTGKSAQSSLNLTPNPVSDNVTLYDTQIHIGDNVTIYNATGLLVYTAILNGIRAELPVTQLANGLYIIVIRSDVGLVKNKGKLVVLHP